MVRVLAMQSVLELSTRDFKRDKDGVFRPIESNIVVMYYAPWCHWCTKLKPVYNEFAAEYEQRNANNANAFKIASLDCESNKEIANELDLEGFPTIILYSRDKKVEYQGDRSKDALMKFTESNHDNSGGAKKGNNNRQSNQGNKKNINKANENTSSFFGQDSKVVLLNDKNFDMKAKTLKGVSTPVIILFFAPWCHWCNQIKPVWNDIAKSAKQGVTVAALDCTKYPVVGDFLGIDGYPTIKLYQGSDLSSEVPYFGERSVNGVTSFLQKKLANPVVPNAPSKDTLSASTLNAGKPAFLCFYDPKNDQSVTVKELVLPSVMQKFQKYVRVGAIDSTKYGDIAAKMNVTKLPSCVLVNDDKITPFTRSVTLENISQFLYDKVVLTSSKQY